MERIVIVSGSHRAMSQSRRVAEFIRERCGVLFNQAPQILDLDDLKVPLWEESFRKGDSPWPELWTPVSRVLTEARGLIFVSPEWGGMVPPGLKNFLLLCSANELGHKPGLLVAVSASRGGAYPIAELRTSGYKNNKICFIPDHLIVRNVGEMLLDGDSSGEDDQYIRNRLDWTLQVFALYAKAFDHVREHADLLTKREYRYGM